MEGDSVLNISTERNPRISASRFKRFSQAGFIPDWLSSVGENITRNASRDIIENLLHMMIDRNVFIGPLLDKTCRQPDETIFPVNMFPSELSQLAVPHASIPCHSKDWFQVIKSMLMKS